MYEGPKERCTCAFCTISVYFYTVNVLYMICGATFIVFGVLMETVPQIQQQILSYDLVVPPKILIPVGAMMLIVSFIGFCGSKIDHYCMLITYVCIATFFLLFTIAATIALLVFPVHISEAIKTRMKREQNQYDTDEKARIYWDRFHNTFHCCGIYEHTEWMISASGIPFSCCQSVPDNKNDTENDYCVSNNKQIPYLRKVGCLKKLDDAYKHYSTIIMICSITACVVQTLCILCAWCIGRRLKKTRNGCCLNCCRSNTRLNYYDGHFGHNRNIPSYSFGHKMPNSHHGNFAPMANNMNYGVLNSAFRSLCVMLTIYRLCLYKQRKKREFHLAVDYIQRQHSSGLL